MRWAGPAAPRSLGLGRFGWASAAWRRVPRFVLTPFVRRVILIERFSVFVKGIFFYCIAQFSHHGEVEREVVEGDHLGGQGFAAAKEMVDVGAAEAAAEPTAAVRIGREAIFGEPAPPDVEGPLGGKKAPMAGVPRRQYAVEEIESAADAVEDVRGRADSHEVAGRVLRHPPYEAFEQGSHLVVFLAHRQPAEGVAAKAHLHEPLEALAPQLFVQAPLDDAEEALSGL